jgi:glycosyltransferase involved in cell wall biosynthesis
MPYYHQRVAVIIPAFNESLSIKRVVEELRALKAPQNESLPLIDDLIVVNNGSSDGTAEIAKRAGANVFSEFRRGYGFACLRGVEQLQRPDQLAPNVVVFVDGDHSVDASQLVTLLHAVAEGNDLVVGSRVGHLQEAQSIGLHQQMGNELASGLIRYLWKEPITDLGPFRAIKYPLLKQLDMQDQGFGWTVEMQIKAIQAGMSYKEVSVRSLKRIGVSKISGTLRGTIGAAIGIFSMVFKLYCYETKFLASLKSLPE